MNVFLLIISIYLNKLIHNSDILLNKYNNCVNLFKVK